MKSAKLIILSFTVTMLFSVITLAQDSSVEQNKTQKTETVKEAEGCSDAASSCCGTTEKVSAVEAPWNKVCPVMGNEVDPSVKTIEYKGRLYGFCCDGCDDKFAKDPARYSRNLSKDGTKFTKARS
jgi:YHS domain-containing protein